MLMLVVVLIVSSLAGLAASRLRPGLRGIGLFAGSALVTIVVWIVWSILLMGGVVQIDPMLRGLGISRLDPPWPAVLLFGPPILAGAAFALIVWFRRATSGSSPDGR